MGWFAALVAQFEAFVHSGFKMNGAGAAASSQRPAFPAPPFTTAAPIIPPGTGLTPPTPPAPTPQAPALPKQPTAVQSAPPAGQIAVTIADHIPVLGQLVAPIVNLIGTLTPMQWIQQQYEATPGAPLYQHCADIWFNCLVATPDGFSRHDIPYFDPATLDANQLAVLRAAQVELQKFYVARGMPGTALDFSRPIVDVDEGDGTDGGNGNGSDFTPARGTGPGTRIVTRY